MPFYLLGRRLEAIYPFVPLSPQNHALSIGVLSYDGGVYFGLAGDRDLLADIDAARRRHRGGARRAGRRGRAATAQARMNDRRSERHGVDELWRRRVGRAHAAVRGGDAERPDGAVDRDPSPAEPAGRQVRLRAR